MHLPLLQCKIELCHRKCIQNREIWLSSLVNKVLYMILFAEFLKILIEFRNNIFFI